MPWNKCSITGLKDHLLDADGSEYGGRIYEFEVHEYGRPKGAEVLTTHLEKLSAPAMLAKHWNHPAKDGIYHWRQAFVRLSDVSST